MDDRIRSLLSRGRESYRANEYAEAEKALSELVAEKRPFPDVYDMMGVIYHQQGKLPEAESMFEEALRLNPNYTEAALNLAVTYNDQGKYDEARQVYDRVISGHGESPKKIDRLFKGKIANMHAEVAHAYLDAALYAEAAAEYKKALSLCPEFHDIRTKYAMALRQAGQTDEAISELERVREENPRFIAVRLNLGLAYFTQGRKHDAEREWHAVLAREPDNKMARLYLSTVAANK